MVCQVSFTFMNFTFILYLRHKCLKKAACSNDIVFNVVLCAMHLLNVVFKLQVAFNINFIVVEQTNVYVICHPQRSSPLSYMYHWQVKATRTQPYILSPLHVTADGVHMNQIENRGGTLSEN